MDFFSHRHSTRATIAVLSAIAIWLAAILEALQIFGLTGGPKAPKWGNNTRSLLRALDYETLVAFWKWKNGQLGVDITVDLLASAGLMGLAFCVLILKRVFRRFKGGHSDLPNFMAACFFIGAAIPSIQWIQNLGFSSSADLISQWDELPIQGLQILQISYMMNRGSTLYLFSLQFFFVPIGLLLSSILSLKTGELPKSHSIFGLITCFSGFITFILEIISFNLDENQGAAIALGLSYLAYGVILLPIWVFWLGVELRRLKQEQSNDQVALQNLNSQ